MISLGSDNHSGIHPKIFKAMGQVNQGSAHSYGMDSSSLELKKVCKKLFGCLDSFLVFNGTAANVLSLQAGLKSYQSVLCTEVSHLNLDECGAAEKITGSRVLSLPHVHGKIQIADLEKELVRKGDQHYSQVKMVSITQPTELGTTYDLIELKDLKEFCKKNDLYLHIDGARLSNAAVTLKTDFQTLCQGSDIVSFGGTKNGLLAGELVLIFNKTLKEGFKFYRKQSLQLPSKTRFFAQAFLEFFANDLWKDIAKDSTEKATYLGKKLSEDNTIQPLYPIQSNGVFCKFPKNWVKSLRKKFFFYVWDENTFEVRLMTSFDTKKEDIDAFVKEVRNLSLSQGHSFLDQELS